MASVEEKILDELAIAGRKLRIQGLIEGAILGRNGLMRVLATGQGSVRVGGKMIPIVGTPVTLDRTAFFRYVLSPRGAGELGMPDPLAALKRLVVTLEEIVSVNVSVDKANINPSVNLDFSKLISLNPHPAKAAGMRNARRIDVASWLQWTTGPSFRARGTPGFGLARVREVEQGSRLPLDKTLNVVGSSRTLKFSDDQAGLMFRITPGRGRRKISQFELMTGKTGTTWSPTSRFAGFWDKWFQQNAAWLRANLTEITKEIWRQIFERP